MSKGEKFKVVAEFSGKVMLQSTERGIPPKCPSCGSRWNDIKLGIGQAVIGYVCDDCDSKFELVT